MVFYIDDYGDKFDKPPYKEPGMAWDFPEDNIQEYMIDNYVYKAKNSKSAKILSSLRKKIDKLCLNLINSKDEWYNSTKNQSYLDGVDIFLGIHCELYHNPDFLPKDFIHEYNNNTKIKTSKYLLSEIPHGTPFDGLNKPKMRYADNIAPHVGKDGNIRATYRDIFLNLSKSQNILKKLLIHELAHTMANHVQFRPDDHHADFIWAENLITEYWPK
jgi:hypothetical protein